MDVFDLAGPAIDMVNPDETVQVKRSTGFTIGEGESRFRLMRPQSRVRRRYKRLITRSLADRRSKHPGRNQGYLSAGNSCGSDSARQ